ncbi:hypothetical protein [uncultured Clostridium sp.]|uniref:hypothetical protein n=1 Tax=uncultured Clostridium sp. TaxID=59620 RepID=UPI0028E38B20|nr:hypothetical protein [uncultured Clostridium sp.]
MDWKEFISTYWKYYLSLEDDFIRTTRYVELDESNFNSYSVEYAKQLQAICSEIDTICKEICNFYGDINSKNFPQYTATILKKYTDISTENIKVILNDTINLEPFKEWNNNSYKSPRWWSEYNAVKHKRNVNFKKANLENVLTSLSGLYVLEKYLLKDICAKTFNSFDRPDKESEIFIITGWKIKSQSTIKIYMPAP